ncbi:E3 ubiquitin-protein ligase TRIM33-like [Glandiceps talaboti]
MASKELKSVEIDENDLTCGICSERYKNAKILPCLHTFCQTCLGRLVKEGKLACPLCRRQHDVPDGDATKLPDDSLVQNLLRQAEKPLESQCGGCDKHGSTTQYCYECAMELCESCVSIQHAKFPATRSHQVIPCNEYRRLQSTDPVSVQPPTYCSKHSENRLKLYCDTCDKVICPECTVTDHPQSKHNYRYLTDVATEVKTKLSGMINSLTTQYDEITESETAVRNMTVSLGQRFEEEGEKINEHAEKIIKDINFMRIKFLTELKNERESRETNLQAQLKEIECLQSDLTHSRGFTERLVNNGSPHQVMSMRTGVTSQIDKLLTCKTKLDPVESDYIEFVPSNFTEEKSLGQLKMKRKYTEWSQCVKNLSVPSKKSESGKLIDGDPNTYWMSSDTSFPRRIHLEMHQDVLVDKLCMSVSQQDGMCKPTQVVVSVGDSISALTDPQTIDIEDNESMVTLLQNLTQYHRFIEIAISRCRVDGFYCRVRGIHISGLGK